MLRIEITDGPNRGTNVQPPTVKYRILEVLREGRLRRNDSSEKLTAVWLDEPAGGENYQAHQRNQTLDEWESSPVESPPKGTRALVLTQRVEHQFLQPNQFFPDTQANRAIAIAHATAEPLLSRLMMPMFWCVLGLPSLALLLLWRMPRSALLFAAAAWPVFSIYASQIPSSAMFRVDLIVLYPALLLSLLVALLAGLKLARRLAASQ